MKAKHYLKIQKSGGKAWKKFSLRAVKRISINSPSFLDSKHPVMQGMHLYKTSSLWHLALVALANKYNCMFNLPSSFTIS